VRAQCRILDAVNCKGDLAQNASSNFHVFSCLNDGRGVGLENYKVSDKKNEKHVQNFLFVHGM
jgi:hypothetical protein